MPASQTECRIDAFRRFNRFYTQRIGVLRKGQLGSAYSLAEARVLYELAHHDGITAAELAKGLELDAGYLSRILAGFQRSALVVRTTSAADARSRQLSLTKAGRKAFAALDRKARAEVSDLLESVPATERDRLIAAMGTIEQLLGSRPNGEDRSYMIRAPRPGELGWVVERHGAIYAAEHRYDERFEALVARIIADFVQNFDPKREQCWIAEREGTPVGCIFLVKHSPTIAKLRLLLVEPQARGLGIGSRLVSECVANAKRFGYRTLRLWTQSHLTDARRLYEAAGFQLVQEEPHHSFGRDLVAQIWELRL